MQYVEVEPTSLFRQQMPYHIYLVAMQDFRIVGDVLSFCTEKFGKPSKISPYEVVPEAIVWARSGQLFAFRHKRDALIVYVRFQGIAI